MRRMFGMFGLFEGFHGAVFAHARTFVLIETNGAGEGSQAKFGPLLHLKRSHATDAYLFDMSLH